MQFYENAADSILLLQKQFQIDMFLMEHFLNIREMKFLKWEFLGKGFRAVSIIYTKF